MDHGRWAAAQFFPLPRPMPTLSPEGDSKFGLGTRSLADAGELRLARRQRPPTITRPCEGRRQPSGAPPLATTGPWLWASRADAHTGR